MLGPLATLIRRELILGPISLETARNYFGKHKENVANLWLETKGIYSEMVRIDTEGGPTQTDYPEYVQQLAEQVAQLQDPVTQFMALDLPQDNRQARFESDYLLNRAWNQIWLRTGVLEFGYQLLSSQAYGLRYTAMEEWLLATPLVESLASGDPTALIRLGHLAYTAICWTNMPKVVQGFCRTNRAISASRYLSKRPMMRNLPHWSPHGSSKAARDSGVPNTRHWAHPPPT